MEEKIFQIIKRLHELQDTGKYTVFYQFSGHVVGFDISIYAGKWKFGKKPVYQKIYWIKKGLFKDSNPYDNNPGVSVESILSEIDSLTIPKL